jgi:hypothetical protein
MRERGEELRAILARFKKEEPQILDAAFRRTRDYLPREASLPEATVVFLPIGYDSRVDGSSIYFDPVMAVMIGREGVTQLLSHELHHVSRFEMTGEVISGMGMVLDPWLADPNGLVRLWAALLEMEGIADCVFDLSELKLPTHRQMIAARERVYRAYAYHLKTVQKALLQGGHGAAGPSTQHVNLAPRVLEHVHPIGARLAREIQDGLGRADLVECVGKPGLFLRRYQQVARSKGLFQFDPSLLARLPPNSCAHRKPAARRSGASSKLNRPSTGARSRAG